MLLVYLPDAVLPAHCRVPRSLGSPPEMLAGHPQSPAPQQRRGNKLSLLMDYSRAGTVGPESQTAAWCTAPLSHGLQEKAE